ncbi:MAG TPA: ATP synthase F1 subunit gamma [Planctomycetota bacterium]|nr:ATP synthase F1 subunit gamma [Planctomycetota bacterium]
MVNIRDLKVRIKAVGNIRQITRAMEMVATTKLRRFQTRAEASGPYTNEIERLVKSLAAGVGGGEGSELFEVREKIKSVGVLVIGSDRGLCGAYNTNALIAHRQWEKTQAGREIKRYVIGKKAMGYFARRKLEVAAYFDDPILEVMGYRDAARLSDFFVKEFVEGRIDEMYVVYSAFKSMTRYVPTVFKFLPLGQIEAGAGDGAEGSAAASEQKAAGDLLLLPSPEVIFSQLVPKYLEARMFNALLESLTSEYASRRVSMKNATDAASDMVGDLKRVYNRARQERITKELLEIVGGAEAVSG